MSKLSIALFALFTLVSATAMASTEAEALGLLQDQWAESNYRLTGKAQADAFESLLNDADRLISEHPHSAPLYTWRGMIRSTYAGVKGGLGALTFAKAAKADLEQALAINDQALQGSAYTSLGTLYFKVPGWPIGFGDDKKAADFLRKALTINPDGIDPNYFYGDYLLAEKRYEEARIYFEKALQAQPRPGRQLADEGRRNEIRRALQAVSDKL